MIKKIVVAAAAACFVLAGFNLALASDPGPAEMKLETTDSKKPKPAIFPHKAHQDALKCADCHHGMDADGNQVAYVEGQEIGKCESCHNPEKLAGKTKGKLKLDTFKGAAHGNCLECHKEIAKKDAAKKDLKKCSTCHPKK